MSLLTHLDAVANHATRISGGWSDELSSALLVISGVAMGAAGVGLIILCARALLAKSPATPQPWIAMALSSPTIHTRKFSEVEAEAAAPTRKPSNEMEAEALPLSDPEPAPVTLRRPEPAVLFSLSSPAETPMSSRLGPSSTDPTLEMDLGAFAAEARSDNDVSPVEVSPPSEPTDTEVFFGSPIPLVARKGNAGQTLESFPAPIAETPVPTSDGREPLPVHRSGTVPKADPDFMRTLPSFTDGARRA